MGMTSMEKILGWGTWVTQSVWWQTLDLSSGLHLRVVNSSSALGSMLDVEPT